MNKTSELQKIRPILLNIFNTPNLIKSASVSYDKYQASPRETTLEITYIDFDNSFSADGKFLFGNKKFTDEEIKKALMNTYPERYI